MKIKDFAKIYFTLVLVHLAVLDVGENLMLIRFTKPLLLASLLAFYLSHTSERTLVEKRFAGALVFSLLGDVFLMFENESVNWFFAGLSSFVVAHLFFASAFYRDLGGEKGFLQKNKFFICITFIILIVFNVFLRPLPEMFGIPVALYSIVIVLAWNSSINRLSVVQEKSFWLVLIGMSLFVFSDSLIAVTKFKEPLEHGPVIIMATYFIGQFLITWGMLHKRIKI